MEINHSVRKSTIVTAIVIAAALVVGIASLPLTQSAHAILNSNGGNQGPTSRDSSQSGLLDLNLNNVLGCGLLLGCD